MAGENLSALRVADQVLTTIVHGYMQADSIAPFVAPVVPVSTRQGLIVKHSKEQFAVVNTRRTPGANIQRVATDYTNEGYTLHQHSVGAEVTEEAYQEALNGQAKIDLRVQAANRAAAAIAQSWELEVVQTITNEAKYEPTNVISTTSANEKWDDPDSDIERWVQEAQEVIRAQVGCYANSMLISPKLFNAMKFHPTFRDRIKYTSAGSVNLQMLASWLDLPGGIRIASKVYLNSDGTLTDFMPADTAVLFYSPANGLSGDGVVFRPLEGADRAVPSAFYTYQLSGYPIAGKERFDEDRRVFVTDVIAEQSIMPVGLGATGKVGAAALLTDLLTD